MAQIKGSLNLLTRHLQSKRSRTLDTCKSIYKNLQGSNVNTKNIFVQSNTQIRFYAKEKASDNKKSSKDYYANINAEWEKQKGKIEADMAEKEKKGPGRISRFWDSMTGRKEEFKRKSAEKKAFKASREKLEEDRAEREGRGYKQELRDKEKTRPQDVDELSFAEKWKKLKDSRRKRNDRSIYERFFIEEWMLHPNVLIGTEYTNMDFWWNGNSSNQLTLYQERSDLVNKLFDQRWGHKPSETMRNMMRDSEKNRDALRAKTQHRNPLVGDENWQDRPFWMRSAMVLDNVYPLLEKQAMNLYDLKEAEHYTSDLRFIWEKQEAYVESLKYSRDLKALFVKNPIPDEVDEVIDFPIPRKISPELSRQIEEEMLHKGMDVDPIADMIQGLKQGKPIPYGPDFDLDKTYDKYNAPVHYPALDKAVAKFEAKLRKQREFNPDDYETEEEREKARKHFEGMAELEKFVNERRVFLERKHLEEFQEREGISLESIQTYTEEELAYEIERQLAYLTDQPFDKEQPLSWEQVQRKKAAEAKAAAEKPAEAAAPTDAAAATTEGATTDAADPNAAAQASTEPPPAQMVFDTTPDEDDPAAKLKAEAKRRKEAAKKAAAAKPKPMTKEVLKLFPDAEEQAKRLKFAEEDDEAIEGEDDWIDQMWEAEYKNTPKFTEKESEFRKIMAQGVEIDMLKLRREERVPIASREPDTVIDRMWQKWLDMDYDVKYSDPEQTCKELTEYALKPPLIDVVVIKKFIEDQLTKTNGILRPYYATKIEVMMKFRDQIRMYMDERVYLIPRKILMYNQQQVLQEEEDKAKKIKNSGFTTQMGFELMNLLELAKNGEAIEGERFVQGNYIGSTYEWHAPMTRLEDRFVFSAYAERLSHRMESLGYSELVRTNDGIKVPANFNHDHFPNPYAFEWQNPQGLSEPDEAHIVNTHVGDKVNELLFGSYPEAMIEQLDKFANSNNPIDMGLSGFYRKMRDDILNWYVKFRERERVDDNKDESRYFFKLLEHFRPGHNHSEYAWEHGRRMPIWRVKMEEDELEYFTLRGKFDRRAFPGDSTREYSIQLVKPVYDQEFVETMFMQNDQEVISDYVQNLTAKAKPNPFDYITTPENVYYDFHHRVKIVENPDLDQDTEIKPLPKKFTADFLKDSTPEQIQRRIEEYRKNAEKGLNILEQPQKSENFKLRMTFEKVPAIPINRFMWQWDYRADPKERFETPLPNAEQVMELYHYEEMQQRYERALANGTEVTELSMPYSREKRRQALLLTQPNLKFADELVYSASTFSSTRANHFMHDSILAPIEKHVYGPLRDVREKIKAGLMKEAEAILMETERKALKMTPHEYYVERKSKSQKEEELARGSMKRMSPEEEEQWKLQLQQRFDDYSDLKDKDVQTSAIDSKEAELAAIRERIRRFHEENSKTEEQEEERALRNLEQSAGVDKFKNVGLQTLFAKNEAKATKVVEKGVPQPEELQDPVLRSDDTQILIQLKREPEDFEAQLAEGSAEAEEDSGMTVSTKGDGRQDIPADKEHEAEKPREEPQAPESTFTVSKGPAPFTFTAEEAPKKEAEEPVQAKAQEPIEEPVQAKAQEPIEEPVRAKPQEATEEPVQAKVQEEPVKSQAEARVEEARARTAEFAEQIREEAATRSKRIEEHERVDVEEEAQAKDDKQEKREEEYIDPRDREDHERVDVAERSEDTELDKMQEAETRSKYEQRREKREKESQEAGERGQEVSVLDSFFADERGLAQIEAEKMLAEHQKQIDDNTGFKGLIKASKERQGKAGTFGISLRSTPEGGVGKVKEAAATAFNEDVRKRISNFDLRIFAKTFTPIAFHALGAFVKGDMQVLADLCSKELFNKLATDWKKLRAIGIETNCDITSKGKPKLVAAMPGKVEEGIELPPMLTFSMRIRFNYWVTYHGKTIAGGPTFVNRGRCLVTACLNKEDKFEIMEMDVQNERLSAANDMFIHELIRIKEERESESERKAKEANAAEAEKARAEQRKQRQQAEQEEQKKQQEHKKQQEAK
eukprot:TRINITY_DN3118_c0_g1_i1.p1 TRINITY_DN3118_c0_g1~~TRINITY_DN3118_c0_g1_i1.p1  ORF type:complete len:2015 (-),score=746.86 TRINITY_DN3118_c0_g1_i1:109-6153(-)